MSAFSFVVLVLKGRGLRVLRERQVGVVLSGRDDGGGRSFRLEVLNGVVDSLFFAEFLLGVFGLGF